MPTPAQTHFKDQIRELNQAGYPINEETIYHPVKRKQNKRPWWTFSIIGIILFLVAFSNIPIKLYNDIVVYKDRKMFDYIKMSEQYNLQTSAIINTHLTQISQRSEPNSVQLQQDKEMLNKLIVETKQLKAPANFTIHKELLIDILQDRLFIITYLEMLAKTNSPYGEEITVHTNDVNVKQEMLRSTLIQAFEKSNIDYTSLSDGTIQYEYKRYYNRN